MSQYCTQYSALLFVQKCLKESPIEHRQQVYEVLLFQAKLCNWFEALNWLVLNKPYEESGG